MRIILPILLSATLLFHASKGLWMVTTVLHSHEKSTDTSGRDDCHLNPGCDQDCYWQWLSHETADLRDELPANTLQKTIDLFWRSAQTHLDSHRYFLINDLGKGYTPLLVSPGFCLGIFKPPIF